MATPSIGKIFRKERKGFWLAPERAADPARAAARSRLIRRLRLVLPVAAAGLVALVMVWPQLEKTMASASSSASVPAAQEPGRNELINPRFVSEDDSQQPFTITAARAIRHLHDPDSIILEKPMADIVLKDNTWLAVQADQGAWRQTEEKLFLQGNVRLYHDQGYELKTDKMTVGISDRKAHSDRPVTVQGPAGTLHATGLQADAAAQILLFTGPVKLVLNRKIEGL